jgi:hypothetical protein
MSSSRNVTPNRSAAGYRPALSYTALYGKIKQRLCNVLRRHLLLCDSNHYDSRVGVATGCVLDNGGVGDRIPVGSGIFSTSSTPALGPAQPPIQWVPGGSFSVDKAAGA